MGGSGGTGRLVAGTGSWVRREMGRGGVGFGRVVQVTGESRPDMTFAVD